MALPGPSKLSYPKKHYRSRRTILSSDDDSEIEIIEATQESIEKKAHTTDTALKSKAVVKDVEDHIQATDSDDAIIVL